MATKPVAKAKKAPNAPGQTERSARSPKAGDLPNAIQKPLQPSKDLTMIVGVETLSGGDVVRKLWAYIKANKLQNSENSREIIADVFISNIAPLYLPIAGGEAVGEPVGGREPAAPQGE